MNETIVPLGVFAMLTVSLGLVTRLIATAMLNKTIRAALKSDRGVDHVALLAGKLDLRQPWADALLGWIFVATAVSIALIALFEDDGQRRDMFQVAVIPLIVGITILAFVRFTRSGDGGQGSAPRA